MAVSLEFNNPPGLFGPSIPLGGEFLRLHTLCKEGIFDTYVGVQYASGLEKTFRYDECYPSELPGHGIAQKAVFCKSATCYGNMGYNTTYTYSGGPRSNVCKCFGLGSAIGPGRYL
ncbi:hypothetical protein BDZ94DRAFT_1303921 [Collybia nuda]|uniref:Uncharacterized protein n=1 Tax=Collybia nuda TaxID=64659 RepID=A0A9P5YIX3_9AGAR|nr:hypothetical protein BDZ94DRAFT_1303921 [Collybia nuda]